jgi:hypothetical protein
LPNSECRGWGYRPFNAGGWPASADLDQAGLAGPRRRERLSLVAPLEVGRGFRFMKIFKTLVLAFVGLFIGLGLAVLSQDGYLQRWEKLNKPSQDILRNFSAPDIQATDHRYQYTKPCDYSSVEFSQFSDPPKNIVECVQVKQQYAETARLETYVRDNSGGIWQWFYYADPANNWLYLLCPSTLGFIVGIIIAILLIFWRRPRQPTLDQ